MEEINKINLKKKVCLSQFSKGGSVPFHERPHREMLGLIIRHKEQGEFMDQRPINLIFVGKNRLVRVGKLNGHKIG